MSTASYRVSPGTQVHVGGVTYEGGESVDVDGQVEAATIAAWLNAGWIEPVTKPASSKAR